MGQGALFNRIPFISGILRKSQQTKAEAWKGMVGRTQETAGSWGPHLGQSLLSIGVFWWPCLACHPPSLASLREECLWPPDQDHTDLRGQLCRGKTKCYCQDWARLLGYSRQFGFLPDFAAQREWRRDRGGCVCFFCVAQDL